MSLPKLTGLTPADIAEFDSIIDNLRHGEAKFLDAWMTRMIAAQLERDRQSLADLEALTRQLEQEARPMTKAERISAYVDELADGADQPSPFDNVH